MNNRNPWAFEVSDNQRRAEIIENEQWIRQIDAAAAAGLHAVVDAVPNNSGFVDTAWMPFLGIEVARAMGLDDAALGSLADYCDINRDHESLAWVPDSPERGWYQIGAKALTDLRDRFGESVDTTAAAKVNRNRAVRRLRTAKNALGIR